MAGPEGQELAVGQPGVWTAGWEGAKVHKCGFVTSVASLQLHSDPVVQKQKQNNSYE